MAEDENGDPCGKENETSPSSHPSDNFSAFPWSTYLWMSVCVIIWMSVCANTVFAVFLFFFF